VVPIFFAFLLSSPKDSLLGDSNQTLPPDFSIIAFIIYSPSPVPTDSIFLTLSALKSFVNIFGCCSSGIPHPLSDTFIKTFSFSFLIAILMG